MPGVAHNRKPGYTILSTEGDALREIATLFKALGDETRLRMLWLLLNHRELCVCDFMEVLGVTQSKASRHLRNLFHAGLVSDRREGLWVYYSLRRFEAGLVRSSLRAIKAGLEDSPEAQEVSSALEGWLIKKETGQGCTS